MSKPRIILEGHFMTFKTVVASEWSHIHDVTYVSGDWNTRFGCPLWGYPQYPPRRVVKRACNDIVNFIELFPDQSFIIDRFHISQQYYDKVFGTHYYNSDIEKRLARMGSIIVYLRNQFDSYEEALRGRMDNHHSHMVNYPKTIDEYREQECVFAGILQKTTLPYVEYDVTGKNVDEIIQDLEKTIRNYQ